MGVNTLIVDCPWKYSAWKGKKTRTADSHYPVMSVKELCEMRSQIDSYCSDNTVLFMWATAPAIQDAFTVMTAWGFTYKTFGLVWVKTSNGKGKVVTSEYPVLLDANGFHGFSIGLGHYTRANVEIALLGSRGRIPVAKGFAETQLIFSERREHSRKPDEQYEKIERLYPNAERRIELFARQKREGWESYGNETNKFNNGVV